MFIEKRVVYFGRPDGGAEGLSDGRPVGGKPGGKPETGSGKLPEKARGVKEKTDLVCTLGCDARAKESSKISAECIKELAPENLKKAREDLAAALKFLNTPDFNKKLKGYGMVIDFSDVEKYLPLMIKESKLDNRAISNSGAKGYFQLTPIAVKEMENRFGKVLKSTLPNKGGTIDPVNNCIYGILYYHWVMEKQAVDGGFKSLASGDRKLVGYMMYNAGFQAIQSLWSKLLPRPKSFAEFEKAMAGLLAKKLGAEDGPAKTVLDETYNVCYQEFPGVTKYVEMWKPKDPVLEEKIKVGNQQTKVRVGKVGEVLRYARVIEAIGRMDLKVAVKVAGEKGQSKGVADAGAGKKPAVDGGGAGGTGSKDGGSRLTDGAAGKIDGGAGRVDGGVPESPGGLAKSAVVDGGVSETADGGSKDAGRTRYDAGRDAALDAGAGRKEDVGPEIAKKIPNLMKVETVADKRRLWSMSNELMEYCKDKNIEGCKNLDDYHSRVEARDRLLEAILRYNKRYNLSFKNIDIGVDGAADKIGVGVVIFIPNETAVRDLLKEIAREGEGDSDDVEDVEDTPEARKIKGELSLYIDLKMDREGRERLKDKYKFDESKLLRRHGTGKRTVSGLHLTKEKRKETKYIILHSTESVDPSGAIKGNKAHYVVDSDGQITYITDRSYDLDHAGRMKNNKARAIWQGDGDISGLSIGIEVVALKSKEWNDKQYEAVKRLVHWLGETYGIEKRNVLAHHQVAVSNKNYRGRKGDPYGITWSKLGLPDNSQLLDVDVILGVVTANLETIKKDMEHDHGTNAWYKVPKRTIAGLEKSAEMAGQKKYRELAEKARKSAIEKNHKIFVYRVEPGDNLSDIAAKFNSTTVKIQLYNHLTSNFLRVGQTLSIPIPK